MHLVVMGVAGSGKTSVGRATAALLGWPFIDADDYHSPANRQKMARGEALTDDDRAGWLDSLASVLADRQAEGLSVVLACSALRQAYRDRLARAGAYRLAYLKGEPTLVAARLAARRDHWFDPSLVGTQFATLEEPTEALVLDIGLPVEALACQAAAWARQAS